MRRIALYGKSSTLYGPVGEIIGYAKLRGLKESRERGTSGTSNRKAVAVRPSCTRNPVLGVLEPSSYRKIGSAGMRPGSLSADRVARAADRKLR